MKAHFVTNKRGKDGLSNKPHNIEGQREKSEIWPLKLFALNQFTKAIREEFLTPLYILWITSRLGILDRQTDRKSRPSSERGKQ